MLSTHSGEFGRGPASWIQLGAGRATMHFAAANGFPVGAYSSFLSRFTGRYTLLALENRGLWPGQLEPDAGFSWQDHADDLIAFLDRQQSEGKSERQVIGVGHSIGATLTLLAAVKRPDLFSRLVLIDPASTLGFTLATSDEAEHLLRAELVNRTLRRKSIWNTTAEFRAYLQTKAVYRDFVGEALDDYAEAGLVPSGDHFKLCYPPAWEAHNFAMTPAIGEALAVVTVPTLLLYAEHSPMYSASMLADLKPGFSPAVATRVVANAGHLIPQELPDLVYQLSCDWLESMAVG